MSNAEKVKWSYKVIQDILDLTLKIGSQETPGATCKFGLGSQMDQDKG